LPLTGRNKYSPHVTLCGGSRSADMTGYDVPTIYISGPPTNIQWSNFVHLDDPRTKSVKSVSHQAMDRLLWSLASLTSMALSQPPWI